MDTRAELDPTNRPSADRTEVQGPASAAPGTNGPIPGNGVGHPIGHLPMPNFKRAVTPSTFKLDETPEEREARVRDQRAVLESLRAKSEEEADEQRETLEFLIAALNEGRAPFPKLFSDRDDE